MESSATLTEIGGPIVAPVAEERYKVIVFNEDGTRILAAQGSDPVSLPVVRIARFARIAQQITAVIKEVWGIISVLLWSSPLEPGHGTANLAVLEAISQTDLADDRRWVHIQDALLLFERHEAHLIETAHSQALESSIGNGPKPFSHLGWMHRLRSWISRDVLGEGTEVRGFVQLTGSEAFSLVKFETNCKHLWFKAVGKPNEREFTITLLLARLFPDYVPKVLASDQSLSGWVMESAGETTLRDYRDRTIWVLVTERLADLQLASVGKAADLLAAGCRDARTSTLLARVGPFFDVMKGIMRAQTKSSPAPLTVRELQNVAHTIHESLIELQDCGIPDTLGHADCNPGNIVVNGSHCVFFDWAEALVGCPVFTFEYLLNFCCRFFPSLAADGVYFRQTYSRRWHQTLSIDAVERTLRLSPLIAAYAYVASTSVWCEHKREPATDSYLRSIVRRMALEAGRLETSSCRN